MFDPAPLLLSSVQDLNLQDEPASNLDKIQNVLSGKVTLDENDDIGIEYDVETEEQDEDDDEAQVEEELVPRRRGKDQDWKKVGEYESADSFHESDLFKIHIKPLFNMRL